MATATGTATEPHLRAPLSASQHDRTPSAPAGVGGVRRTLDAMRLLGVLGGMSWTSTESYYRGLDQGVAARLGGLH